jgi:hypothetical protein
MPDAGLHGQIDRNAAPKNRRLDALWPAIRPFTTATIFQRCPRRGRQSGQSGRRGESPPRPTVHKGHVAHQDAALKLQSKGGGDRRDSLYLHTDEGRFHRRSWRRAKGDGERYQGGNQRKMRSNGHPTKILTVFQGMLPNDTNGPVRPRQPVAVPAAIGTCRGSRSCANGAAAICLHRLKP